MNFLNHVWRNKLQAKLSISFDMDKDNELEILPILWKLNEQKQYQGIPK